MDNESARSADDSQEPRPQTDVQGATGSDAQGTPPYPIGLNPPLPPKQPTSTPTSPPHSPRSNGSHSSHGANPKLRSSRGTSMQDVLELRKHPLKSFSDPFDGKHGGEAAAAAVVEGVASSLHCPITKQLMTDPVFTMDGQVTKTLILTFTLTLILTLTLTLTVTPTLPLPLPLTQTRRMSAPLSRHGSRRTTPRPPPASRYPPISVSPLPLTQTFPLSRAPTLARQAAPLQEASRQRACTRYGAQRGGGAGRSEAGGGEGERDGGGAVSGAGAGGGGGGGRRGRAWGPTGPCRRTS